MANKSNPTVILRSGWQTVNIGDIAHSPGVMRVLRRQLPNSKIILWSTAVDRGVDAMLQRNFPNLRILTQTEGPDVQAAIAEADFFLHGSGPSVVGREQLAKWAASTKKPYGVFGVTVVTGASEAASGRMDEKLKSLLDNARFVYTRETTSLANVKASGVRAPRVEFVPDGAFSFDLRDDARADAFLNANDLEAGRFICVIPRLRLTPYHRIRPNNAGYSQAEIQRRDRINQEHGEADHAKLREAMIAYVRKTGGKVLLVPEMTYELDIMDPLLYDPLPRDVRMRVVRRGMYWLPDEAASTYRKAAAVLSSECHSPILAAGQETPCMYVHQPEDGIKGRMWKDVGLGSWYFDVEAVTGAQIAETLLDIVTHPEAAKRRVTEAVGRARDIQASGMSALVEAL